MQIIECQVKDANWAYKDSLKEILASDNESRILIFRGIISESEILLMPENY